MRRMMSRNKGKEVWLYRRISALCLLLTMLFGLISHSAAENHGTIRIGVLAKRGEAIALSRWQPTVDYLGDKIPSYHFELVPLDFRDIRPAVAGQKIDYILANPGIYVELEVLYGVSRIATLKTRDRNTSYPMFGGVIFTRADRGDIHTLADIRGKRFAAVEENSLGGYLMAMREIKRAGLEPRRDNIAIEFAGTHDAVVYSILKGEDDVGTVRTDTLERMAAEGKIKLEEFRVINPNQTPPEVFHYLLSTPLYPEWPFAKLRHTPNQLTQEIATALLQMPADSTAANACDCSGWTIPLNYQPVHELLRELNVSPYENYGKITWQNLLRQYWDWFIAGMLIMITLGFLSAYLIRLNSELKLSKTSLQQARDNLEHRVQERTADLIVANRQLARTSRDKQLILDSAGDGIYGIDANGLTTFINPKGALMLGWDSQELIGRSIHELAHHTYHDGRHYPGDECPTHKAILEGRVIHVNDEVFWCKDGSHFHVEYTSTPIIDDGVINGAVVVFRDISQRRRDEERLRMTATVFENTTEGIIITDPDTRIISVNEAFSTITGYSTEESLGRKPSMLKSGRHDVHFYEAMWDSINREGQWFGEIWNRRKNGELYPEWLNINVVRDEKGQVSHYVGVFSDITTIKQSELDLEFLAHHDPLTELPNRMLFEDRLSHALQTAHRQQGMVALLFLDLDRFKIINDTMGHQCGDTLLQMVAERLQGCLREQDTVARLGGDEFTIILENIHDIDEITAVAKKIQAALASPIYIDGQQFYITTSIGISLYPNDGTNSEALVKNADTAMYRAKEKGRNNHEFYSAELTASALQHLSLDTGLRHALERDEYFLLYQPQIDLHGGKIIGFETLLRWRHPTQGVIGPDSFIPHAEETGLIVPIGEWVLHRALQEYGEWMAKGLPPVRLAVNLSSKQLFNENFPAFINTLLEESGMPAERLELELTESQLMGHAEEAIHLLRNLKQRGVHFSIDDFGTGYSSLNYLKRFTIDKLKIDKTFIEHLPDDQDGAEICKAIIALAHSLNLEVVAEGIEKIEQLNFLRQNQCHIGQGIMLGRPVTTAEVEKLLAKSHIMLPAET